VNTHLALSPALADALARLQAIAPSAIVAGGFLRDSLLGAEAKDIDVFATKLTSDQLAALVVAFPDAKQEPYAAFLEYANSEVQEVWHLGTVDGLPLQLIEVTGSPIERAMEHDFGLCQVWHDGVQMWTTCHFVADAEAKQFVLRQCESQNQFDRSMKRYARLSNKYPGYALSIPEEFQQWATTI
jgi:hypothetical protein